MFNLQEPSLPTITRKHSYFPVNKIGHPLSFYRWLPIYGHSNGVNLEADLKKLGVRVFHSDRFLSGQSSSEKYLRIALSSTQSLDDLHTGLKVLSQYLDKQKK